MSYPSVFWPATVLVWPFGFIEACTPSGDTVLESCEAKAAMSQACASLSSTFRMYIFCASTSKIVEMFFFPAVASDRILRPLI